MSFYWYNYSMLTDPKEKRRFYRHPIGVPITLSPVRQKKEIASRSLDVSLGGLSFYWPQRLSKGSLIDINIAVKDKRFEIKSKIAYTKEDPSTGQYRTGVCFADYPSAFMARLAEEMLEIIQYRKNLSQKLGREVSEDEAANEWIKKYAAKFPGLN